MSVSVSEDNARKYINKYIYFAPTETRKVHSTLNIKGRVGRVDGALQKDYVKGVQDAYRRSQHERGIAHVYREERKRRRG